MTSWSFSYSTNPFGALPLIGIGFKTEKLSNDRIETWIQRFDKKKSNIGDKTNRVFFSIIFIQRFAAKIGIGAMKWLTPRLMLEHYFDELSKKLFKVRKFVKWQNSKLNPTIWRKKIKYWCENKSALFFRSSSFKASKPR